jgi:formyl-CoA transferase
LVEVEDPIAGKVVVSGDFWHFSRTPAVVGTTPTVGEHTDDILASLLNLSEEQVTELRDGNVIT